MSIPFLTESELEIAAREYCKLSGKDPDHEVLQNDKETGKAKYKPLWRFAMQDVKQFLYMQAAIEQLKGFAK